MIPSPCDGCPKNNRTSCSETCSEWERWFKTVWRGLRRQYLPRERLTIREQLELEVAPNE